MHMGLSSEACERLSESLMEDLIDAGLESSNQTGSVPLGRASVAYGLISPTKSESKPLQS